MLTEPQRTPEPLRVLVVDHDQDIQDLVHALLTDEGYAVDALSNTDYESVAAAVGRLEPDCILLDDVPGTAYLDSWSAAASIAHRTRPVPTVMFSANASATREARDGTSERARAAEFADVLQKPFSLDELLECVASASGRSVRFDGSDAANDARTVELANELRAAGATDIRTSRRREWATFTSPEDDRIYQLYWWQGKGLYMVGRYDAEARLEMIGHHFERRSAIEAAISPQPA
jgi:CheY-like chemotaxis protein